jgi:hypothetical protein
MKRFRDHFLGLLPYTVLSPIALILWKYWDALIILNNLRSPAVLRGIGLYLLWAVVAGLLVALLGATIKTGRDGMRQDD